jgi:cytochrome c553
MVRATGPFRTANRWPRIGWQLTATLIIVSFLLAFLVIAPAQQGGARLGAWAAICRGLGITSDTAPALELRPPLRTPTRIAWTPETLAFIGKGDTERGAFVALNCVACHGPGGRSASGLYPTLAGMEAPTIFKQLDDFRSGKRSSGVMQAIAMALTLEASADVAVYFASRSDGLEPARDEPLESGHSLRESDDAVRLVFAGDPARGIPPCSACHGPSDIKLGAPRLSGQQPAYIERQLAAFAQGLRQNDINEQMRTVASALSPAEMHLVAERYSAIGAAQVAQR